VLVGLREAGRKRSSSSAEVPLDRDLGRQFDEDHKKKIIFHSIMGHWENIAWKNLDPGVGARFRSV